MTPNPVQDPGAASTVDSVPPTWSPTLLLANFRGSPDVEVPRTWSQACAVFCLHPTALVVGTSILALACLRSQQPFHVADAAGLAVGAAAWVLQEWFIHKKLFHGSIEWFGKDVHTSHHATPYHHITIDGLDLVAPAMIASLLIFSLAAGSETGQCAALGYWSFGLFYIFSHYLVHTRYAPRSTFWRQMRQHHMQHHCRNEDYWLSFTVRGMDTLMGTNPAPSSVPMTDMARAGIKTSG